MWQQPGNRASTLSPEPDSKAGFPILEQVQITGTKFKKELNLAILKYFVDQTSVLSAPFVIHMWEKTIRNLIAAALMSLAMASTAQALTFKKGEVLGSDGQTYSGASP